MAAAGIGDAWKGAQHTSSNGVFLSRGTSARTHAETNLHVMYVRTVQLIGPSVCRFYNSMQAYRSLLSVWLPPSIYLHSFNYYCSSVCLSLCMFTFLRFFSVSASIDLSLHRSLSLSLSSSLFGVYTLQCIINRLYLGVYCACIIV